MKTWDELKAQGSMHYRNTTDSDIQPIDLYRAAGEFRPFALCSIIKYAYRNFDQSPDRNRPVTVRDMEKIIHYAELLIAACSGKAGE